jgi:hypothetical protein
VSRVAHFYHNHHENPKVKLEDGTSIAITSKVLDHSFALVKQRLF